MAKSEEEIVRLLKNTRFERRIFAGVDEQDVWRKIKRLQEEYAELLETQRNQSLGALNDWKSYAARLEERVRELESRAGGGRG